MTVGNSTSPTDIDAIVGTLAQLIVNELDVDVPIEKIDRNASLEGDLGLDSVAMIELIGAVELEFDIEFSDSDLRTSSFETLRTLADVVANRIRVQAST